VILYVIRLGEIQPWTASNIFRHATDRQSDIYFVY
jgi:hypothetical protein